MAEPVPITIIPTQEDLVSAAVAYGANMWMKGSPINGAIEQLGSIIVAKNIADRTAMTDRPAEATIKEYDIWTGVVRAGYSGFQGRSNNTIAQDGAKGVLCNVVGRYISTQFLPPL